MVIGPYTSTITLNVNGLNAPTKRQRLADWIQKQQNDLCSFPRQIIQYHGNPSLCPTNKVEEAEVEQFYEDLQDLLELTPKKMSFSL